MIWVNVTNGITSTQIEHIGIDSSGHALILACFGGGVFRSTNFGSSWIQLGLPYYFIHSSLLYHDGIILAGTHGDGAFISVNGCKTWRQTALLDLGDTVYALLKNLQGNILAGTWSGVSVTADSGGSWQASGLPGRYVFSLAGDSSGYVFAGTRSYGAYRSTDGGYGWTQMNLGILPLDVLCLAIGPNGGVYAGTKSGGVFHSSNHGADWTRVDSAFTLSDIDAIVVNSGGQVFAGTRGDGVFRSTDNGNHWSQVNQGLTNGTINCLSTTPQQHLFAGRKVGSSNHGMTGKPGALLLLV